MISKTTFDGYVFVIGGKTREDKIVRNCEKYDLTKK